MLRGIVSLAWSSTSLAVVCRVSIHLYNSTHGYAVAGLRVVIQILRIQT